MGHRVRWLLDLTRLTLLVLVQPIEIHSHPGLFNELSRLIPEEHSNKRSFSQYHQFEPASSFSEWNTGPDDYLSIFREFEPLDHSSAFYHTADLVPYTTGFGLEEQIPQSPTFHSLSAPTREEESQQVKKLRPDSFSVVGTGSDFARVQQGSTAQQNLRYDSVFAELTPLQQNGFEALREWFDEFHPSHQETASSPTSIFFPSVYSPSSTDSLPSTTTLQIADEFGLQNQGVNFVTSSSSKPWVLRRLEMEEANAEAYAWIGSRIDEVEKGVFDAQFEALYEDFFKQLERPVYSLIHGPSDPNQESVKQRMERFLTRVWAIHSQFLEVLAINAEHEHFIPAQRNLHQWLLLNILLPLEAWLGTERHSFESKPSPFGWLHNQLSSYLRFKDNVTAYAIKASRKDHPKDGSVTEQAVANTQMAVEIIGAYYKSHNLDKWRKFFEFDDQFLRLLSIIRRKYYIRDYHKYIEPTFEQMAQLKHLMPWEGKEELNIHELKIINGRFKWHFEDTVEKTRAKLLVSASELTPLQLKNLRSIRERQYKFYTITLTSIRAKKIEQSRRPPRIRKPWPRGRPPLRSTRERSAGTTYSRKKTLGAVLGPTPQN